jgi:hypothetical protein
VKFTCKEVWVSGDDALSCQVTGQLNHEVALLGIVCCYQFGLSVLACAGQLGFVVSDLGRWLGFFVIIFQFLK